MDSPRHCTICKAYGNHHTERHYNNLGLPEPEPEVTDVPVPRPRTFIQRLLHKS